MKTFLVSCAAILVIAIATAVVLQDLQVPSAQAYQTSAVRI